MQIEQLLSPVVWLVALGIFFMRIISLALDTLRNLFVVRGQKACAWFCSFTSVLLFLAAIGIILAKLDNGLYMIAYASGFASGTLVGMEIERRLAIGNVQLTVVSPALGNMVAENLRAEGFTVTEVPARGRDGSVGLAHCSVRRRDIDQVETIVLETDPMAFIVAEPVRSLDLGKKR